MAELAYAVPLKGTGEIHAGSTPAEVIMEILPRKTQNLIRVEAQEENAPKFILEKGPIKAENLPICKFDIIIRRLPRTKPILVDFSRIGLWRFFITTGNVLWIKVSETTGRTLYEGNSKTESKEITIPKHIKVIPDTEFNFEFKLRAEEFTMFELKKKRKVKQNEQSQD